MEDAKTDADVLVVGAGPVGLFTAVNLMERGVSTRVVEKRSCLTNLRESKSILLQPRTMELLHHHGLAYRLQQYTVKLNYAVVKDQSHVLSNVDFSVTQQDTLFPYIYVVPQGALERVLHDRLTDMNGVVEWDSELASLEQEDQLVHARYVDGTRSRHSYVIGCDGANGIVSSIIGNKAAVDGSSLKNMPHLPPTIFADVTLAAPSIARNAVTIYLLPNVSCLFFPMQLLHENFPSDSLDLPSPCPEPAHNDGDPALNDNNRPLSYFRVVVSDLSASLSATSAAHVANAASLQRARRASSQSQSSGASGSQACTPARASAGPLPASSPTAQCISPSPSPFSDRPLASHTARSPPHLVDGHPRAMSMFAEPPASGLEADFAKPKGPRAWGSAAGGDFRQLAQSSVTVSSTALHPTQPTLAHATATSATAAGRHHSVAFVGGLGAVTATMSPTASTYAWIPSSPPTIVPHTSSIEDDIEELSLDEATANELALEVSVEEFLSSFHDIGRVAKADVHDVYWLSRYVPETRIAERFILGRIFIAGDSAHSNSIFAGSGLNVGLQDAVNLSWKLALIVQGRGHASLMETYEEERREIGKQMISSISTVTNVLATRSNTLQALRNYALSFASSFQFVHDSLSQSLTAVRLSYANTRLTMGVTSIAGNPLPLIRLLAHANREECNIHDIIYRRNELFVFMFCPNKLSSTDQTWMLAEEAAASIRTRFSSEFVCFCWVVDDPVTAELATLMEDGTVFYDERKEFAKLCKGESLRIFVRPDGIMGAALPSCSTDDLIYLSKILK